MKKAKEEPKKKVKTETRVKAKVKAKPKAAVVKKVKAKVEARATVKPEVKPAPKVVPKVEARKLEAPRAERPSPKPEVKTALKSEAKAPVVPPAPPAPPAPLVKKEPVKVSCKFPITLKDLAAKMNAKPNELIMKLMKLKVMATINQAVDFEVASLIAADYGYEFEKPLTREEEITKALDVEDKTKLISRAPVVTLMGHVDHGKTSLLDAIRKSRLAEKESGGITQHIGAYEVAVGKGHITFLDTPGHEAFTAMRARGAQATDIVILVVASDDGVMPQTKEAIDHARAANVPIVVALNKIDKPDANPDKVKKQLMDIGLMTEDWGGKTIAVGVSAKTGQGIDELLEMLILESEMLELKADPTRAAKGVIIEGKLSKGGGPIATVLVQKGTLRPGDTVVAGRHYGKVRAMISDLGHRINEALPSKPVEILGLAGVPEAGDIFFVVPDEKAAREIVNRRQDEAKATHMQPVKRITLEELSQQVKEGKAKELKIIVKADVQGSVEALEQSLKGLETKDIKLDVIHSGVGSINESDIMLAAASNAIIIGFHADLTPEAAPKAKLEEVDVRLYRIIYEAISDVRSAMEGMLEPTISEVFVGRADVRQVFKVTKAGTIAGCFLAKGKAIRGASCRLWREKDKVFEGKISSLKRFKEDVKEVAEGFECGISLDNFNDVKVGDVIEIFELKKTARKL
ncbi:MAG: translation initiation factor IF-2 [Omnitrophica WOR_2 bacterium RIFCSPLOWO2_12_FULL_51_24]|nr:MAG: translation initiation factor IF-2 [Omnitrophica WOR_2 bacterium RIFCSPLOWO2_12_FULL_51_24]